MSSDQCTGITQYGLRCKRKAGSCRQHGQSLANEAVLHSAKQACFAGEGIFSDAKNFVKRRVKAVIEGPRLNASDRLAKFLKDKQGAKVVKLELSQEPVQSGVQKALDALSFGHYSKKKKELNYDEVMHNSLLVTLSDGTQWKLEKNQTVEHSPLKAKDLKAQRFNIPITKELTLGDMVENASKGQEKEFWRYRAGSNNCQEWTRDMIVRNGLLPDDAKETQTQDASSLIDTLPGRSFLPNLATDTAAVADRVLHGDGAGLPPGIPSFLDGLRGIAMPKLKEAPIKFPSRS